MYLPDPAAYTPPRNADYAELTVPYVGDLAEQIGLDEWIDKHDTLHLPPSDHPQFANYLRALNRRAANPTVQRVPWSGGVLLSRRDCVRYDMIQRLSRQRGDNPVQRFELPIELRIPLLSDQ